MKLKILIPLKILAYSLSKIYRGSLLPEKFRAYGDTLYLAISNVAREKGLHTKVDIERDAYVISLGKNAKDNTDLEFRLIASDNPVRISRHNFHENIYASYQFNTEKEFVNVKTEICDYVRTL